MENTTTSRLRAWGLVLLVALALVTGAGLERWFGGGSVSGSQSHEELQDLDEFGILSQTYDYIRELYVRSDDISDEELIWGHPLE